MIRSRLSAQSRFTDPEQRHLREQLTKGRYLDPTWSNVSALFPDAERWIEQWQDAESLSSVFSRFRTEIGPTYLDSSPLATALLLVFESDLLQWRVEVLSLLNTLLSNVKGDLDTIPGTHISREFLRTEGDNHLFLIEIVEALSKIRTGVDCPPLNLSTSADHLLNQWVVLMTAYQVIPAVQQADYFRLKSLPFNQAVGFDPAIRLLNQNAKIVVLNLSSEHRFDLQSFRNSPPTEVEAYLLGFLPPLLKGQGLSHGIEISHNVLRLFEGIRSSMDETLSLVEMARATEAGKPELEGEAFRSALADLDGMFFQVGQKATALNRIRLNASSQQTLISLAAQMPPGSDLSKAKVNQIELFRKLKSLYGEWSRLDPAMDSIHLEGETIPRVSLVDPSIVNPSWAETKSLLVKAENQVEIVKRLESKMATRAQDRVELQSLLGSLSYRTTVYDGYHLDGEFRVSHSGQTNREVPGLRAWIDPVEAARTEWLEQRIKEMPVTAEGKRISLEINKLVNELSALSDAQTALGLEFQRKWSRLGVESQPYFSTDGLERILNHPMDMETDAHRELAGTYLPKILAIAEKKKQTEEAISRLKLAHHHTVEGTFVFALEKAFADLPEVEDDVRLRNHRLSQVRSYLGVGPVSIGLLESMLDINHDGRLDDQDEAALRLSSEVLRILSH